MIIKIAMLVVFFAVIISVGLYCRKKATSVHNFVLGGRSIGPWMSAFSYGTAYFSAVVFIGYAGQFGWRFGISAVWIGLGNAIIGGLLAWIVLGRRTMVMTRHLGSATMPAFFTKRYDCKRMRTAASAIIFIFLIPYTASLYNGLSRLFSMAFGIDFTICIVVMAALTAIYVIAGGYFASSVNDFIQGIIMLAGIIMVVAAVLNVNGGFTASIDALARVQDLEISTTPGAFASFFGPDPVTLLGVVILTSLGAWGLPQMVQRFYAIQSEKAVLKGTVISTLFALVIAGGSYFLGSFGRLFTDVDYVKANGYDSIVPAMLSGFSDALIGFVIVLVFAASMSTLSALVMTSASTFTLDFLKPGFKGKMNEKSQLLTIRIMILFFIVISAAIAMIQYKNSLIFIAQLMGISWGALAGAFLAPFLYGLYWKRATKTAVWCCFIFSTVFMTLNILVRDMFPPLLRSPINAGAFAMILGLLIVPVVSMFTKAPDKPVVDDAFSCFD